MAGNAAYLQLLSLTPLKLLGAARLDGRAATLGVVGGYGVTAISRAGAGQYTLTHGAAVGSYGVAFGAVTCQGVPGATIGQFAPLTATTSTVNIYNGAGVLTDDLFTVVIVG